MTTNNPNQQSSSIQTTFPCKWNNCAKPFQSLSLLLRHINACHIFIPSDRHRNLYCEWDSCWRTEPFTSQQLLGQHMRAHTKEKPFMCPICNTRFSIRSNFKAHARSRHRKAGSFQPIVFVDDEWVKEEEDPKPEESSMDCHANHIRNNSQDLSKRKRGRPTSRTRNSAESSPAGSPLPVSDMYQPSHNATSKEKELLQDIKLFVGKLQTLKSYKQYLSVLDCDVAKLNERHIELCGGLVAEDDTYMLKNKEIAKDAEILRKNIELAIELLEKPKSILEDLHLALDDERLQQRHLDDVETRGRKRSTESNYKSQPPLKKEKLDYNTGDKVETDSSMRTKFKKEDNKTQSEEKGCDSNHTQIATEDNDDDTALSPNGNSSRKSSGSVDDMLSDSDSHHRYPKRKRTQKKYKEEGSSGEELIETSTESTPKQL